MLDTIEPEVIEIRPQPRQEQFLSSSADIAIFGGAAFGGKTWSLLVEPLRHVDNPDFGAVIFRRTVPELTNEGGLWDEAEKLYPLLGAKPNQNDKQYTFPKGMRVSFSHMQHDKDKYSWKSAAVALIIFDQLETFLASQFFYMLSRNRSLSGVRPYIRASANPEPGWLADFLDWWIDTDGYAILERSGVIRWMVRENDVTYWSDSKDQLQAEHPNSTPLSVTFILSTIYDNKIGMEKDPDYLSKLQALDYIERQRLLGDGKRGGNWKIKPSAGKIFNRDWFEIVEHVPFGMRYVRFWDLAATEKQIGKGGNDPDYTASVKMGKHGKIYYIVNVTNDQIDPAKTDNHILQLAELDGKDVRVRWEKEGGASGKRDAYHIATMLNGWDAQGISPKGDKITRASQGPGSQAYAGNVKLLKGRWNEMYLNHMHGQPDLPHDDVMDATTGAYTALTVDDGSMEYSG